MESEADQELRAVAEREILAETRRAAVRAEVEHTCLALMYCSGLCTGAGAAGLAEASVGPGQQTVPSEHGIVLYF